MATLDLTPEVIESIRANWAVSYAAIGCTAVLFADYFHTLPDEIRYMWPTDMSTVKMLFFLVRYYPFVHTSLALWHHGDLAPLTGSELCAPPFAAETFSCIIVTWICDAVCYLRAYAFSGRKRGLRIFLIVWYILLRVAEFVLLFKFIKSIRWTSFPPEAMIGCLTTEGNTLLVLFVFIGIILSLGSVTFFVIKIAWRRRDESTTERRPVTATRSRSVSLFRIFVRDGIMYFISLSSLALANIIFSMAAPQNGTQYAMIQPFVHANAILTGRMLIHLRESAQTDIEVTRSGKYRRRQSRFATTQNVTDMEFAPAQTSITGVVQTHMTDTTISEVPVSQN